MRGTVMSVKFAGSMATPLPTPSLILVLEMRLRWEDGDDVRGDRCWAGDRTDGGWGDEGEDGSAEGERGEVVVHWCLGDASADEA